MNCMKETIPARTFDLDELCALVGLPKRTVRYYIQLGLVDRPVGETRAARYGPRHVEQLLQIRKWTEAGVSLERIGELLAGGTPPVPPRPRAPGTVEVWSHLVVADGVELTLEPGRAQMTPDEVRTFFRGAQALYRQVTNKDKK